MIELFSHGSHEDLPDGKRRTTIGLRPVNYDVGGGRFAAIASNWIDGDATRPHMVAAAPFLVSVGGDGLRRIHPTRELDRYFEFGAPFIKPAGSWQKVNLGTPTRTKNSLTWTTANAIASIVHAGHYIKLGIELKGGWQPPNGQFAFPVGLNGLTRSGNVLLADGRPVMTMRPPHVEDLSNPLDVRPIASQFVTVGGQAYALLTLPSLTGMARPFVDPTLTLQPDAADGKDTRLLNYAAFLLHNSGTGVELAVGRFISDAEVQHSLIAFNVSSIPLNSIVQSAQMSLWISNSTYTYAGTSVDCYDIAAANAAWPEGTKGLAVGGAGDSCWTFRDQGGAGTNWAGSAGCSLPDVDYVNSIIGTFIISGTSADTQVDAVLLSNAVQAWLTTNNGMLLRATVEAGSGQGFHVHSSDYATAAYRPKLAVVYTLPAGGIPTLQAKPMSFDWSWWR